MSDVFVSYSRKDADFARRLTNSLNRHQLDVWIDWQNIPRGVDWLNAIYAGIEAADVFVFIVSQHSLTSEICNDELSHARQHNKRVIPLIRQEINGEAERIVKSTWFDASWQATAQENWTTLRQINWLFFVDDDEKAFKKEFDTLLKTIHVDLEHVKTHTRLLVRARDWEMKSKNPSFLLIGDGIDTAEAWLKAAYQEEKSPQPTGLHERYITTSRRHADEQQRRLTILRRTSAVAAIVGSLAIFLTIIALLSASNARTERNIAYEAGTQSAYVATVFTARQVSISTLSAGGAVIAVDNLHPTPEAFLATATANAQLLSWEPIIRTIDGVEMVQVPAGCFWMGSISFEYEQPVHEVCFEQPFWIDRYEVSNEQFEQLGGVAEKPPYWQLPMQPRTAVTWREARDFCRQRGARLPTEAEWEYAARGPDSLAYPWGNAFVADYATYAENSDNVAVPVQDNAAGASWVGAINMSGNVWEWTNTIFDQEQFPYPYDADDGREDANRTDVARVIRGSSLRGGYFDYGIVDQIFLGLDLRGAWRLEGLVNFAGVDDGFRCVASDP